MGVAHRRMTHRKMEEEIQLRSEEVKELLTRPPSSLVRWGTVVVASIICCLLGLSFWIKYPDKVITKAIITTEIPPVRVVSRTSGRLYKLLVQEGEKVTADEKLAILDNAARWEDIDSLTRFMTVFDSLKSFEYQALRLPTHFQLGELQTVWSEVVKMMGDLNFYEGKNDAKRKSNDLSSGVLRYVEMNEVLRRQIKLADEELGLAIREKQRLQTMLDNGVAAEKEVAAAESEIVKLKGKKESLNVSIAQNNVNITDLRKQISDVQYDGSELQSAKKRTGEEAVRNLRSALEKWKQTYLIVAPISGVVSFSKYCNVQQFINANEELMTIVPAEAQDHIVVKAMLPAANSGKVKNGQRVLLKLDAYPYREFGLVEGIVTSIALAPDKDGMKPIVMELKNGLTTSYRKTLEFRPELQASAEIVTDDRRLIMRILQL